MACHRLAGLLYSAALLVLLGIFPGPRACWGSTDLDEYEAVEVEARKIEPNSLNRNNTHRYFTEYKTEPSFRAVFFNISHANYSALAPGYFFWAAISGRGTPCYHGCGPSIYDSHGKLVWYGNDSATKRAMRIHTCDYLGEEGNHLCFHDGVQIRFSSNPGTIRFLDNTYTEVATFGPAGNLSDPDLHEVNTPRGYKGRILLQDTFELQEMSMVNSSLEDTESGWGLNCCFQEIDIETKEERFQWCVKDRVPTAGKHFNYRAHPEYWRRILLGGGGRESYAWDFWHLNGVDKDPNGDYLISLRHLNAVLKIAGKDNPTKEPGSILWTLNGRHGDLDKDFGFSMQHAARFVDSTDETDTICFLDNASGKTNDHSTGKLIEVNKSTREARLIRAYSIPTKNIASTAGNMQVIQDNRHVVVGWGSDGSFTEFDPDGNVLIHAKSSIGHSGQAWKYPWVGRPKTRPKILAYSLKCRGSPLFAYASWNGATEVSSWRFFTSHSARGPWAERGTFDKVDFETRANLSITSQHYTYVEALDASGNVLGKSNATVTFVPTSAIRPNCTDTGCHELHFFEYNAEWSDGDSCIHPFSKITSSNVFAILYEVLALVYVFCAVELVCWVLQTMVLPWFAGLGTSRPVTGSEETKYSVVSGSKEYDVGDRSGND